MGKKPPQPGRSKPPSSSSKPSSAKQPKPKSKPTSTSTSRPAPPADKQPPPNPEETRRHQQALLDVFSSAYADVLGRDDFASVLREVKSALFRRDFEGAFSFSPSPSPSPSPSERFLPVYAARWSPPRALCYARLLRRVLASHPGLLHLHLHLPAAGTSHDDPPPPPLRALCVGGGAAELAAFASCLAGSDPGLSADLTLLDTGPWGAVASALHGALTAAPPPSRYVAGARRGALVDPPGRLRWAFERGDALGLDEGGLGRLLVGGGGGGERRPVLVTLLFTLNELYSSEGGVGRTTAFLRRLGAVVPPGSLLLVVDSPGSYSEAAVGKGKGKGKDGGEEEGGAGKRRYPMQWLLDHTLLRVDEDEDIRRRKEERSNRGKPPSSSDKDAGVDGEKEKEEEEENKEKITGCRWEKLESHDSVWFRLADGLRYPIALENMRYQMHLYRACAREG